MDKAQKQKYIFDLLDDARVKKAVRQKHKVPNFERRTVRAAFAVVYFLMRHGWNKAMIALLETVRRWRDNYADFSFVKYGLGQPK